MRVVGWQEKLPSGGAAFQVHPYTLCLILDARY